MFEVKCLLNKKATKCNVGFAIKAKLTNKNPYASEKILQIWQQTIHNYASDKLMTFISVSTYRVYNAVSHNKSLKMTMNRMILRASISVGP